MGRGREVDTQGGTRLKDLPWKKSKNHIGSVYVTFCKDTTIPLHLGISHAVIIFDELRGGGVSSLLFALMDATKNFVAC